MVEGIKEKDVSWQHMYNITTKIAAFPCAQPDPVIIALTLVPAAAPALLEWIGFGCRDIMKFRMGIGAPCGRAMKGQVAKAIPPSLVGVFQNLLKWEHHFSYAGQMFLLADLVTDTVARWTTLAYQLNGCPDALEMAAWQATFKSVSLAQAGVPTSVGGNITNETGTPGIAQPTGAVVPRDWYFEAEFSCQAIGVFDRAPAGLTMWIEQTFPNHYDYPANRYPGGYPFIQAKPHYFLPEQHNGSNGPQQYTYMIISDRDALVTEFSATAQASPIPINNWSLSPLACIKDLGSDRVPDPTGHNPKSRQPSIADGLLTPLRRAVPRGPPGGKPRGRK